MDQFPPLSTFDSDSLSINFDDYLNFPEYNSFPGDPAAHNASLDVETFTLDNPSSPYPHNSSNFELDGFDRTPGLSFFTPSLDFTSVVNPHFEDFEEVEALFEPFDHSSLPAQDDQQELIQMPEPCQLLEPPNWTALVPNTGDSNMVRFTGDSGIGHMETDTSPSTSGPVSSVSLPSPSLEQGSLISTQSHLVVSPFFFRLTLVGRARDKRRTTL